MNPFAAMSAEDLCNLCASDRYRSHRLAGIIGIIKSSGVIGNAFKLAVGGGKGKTVAAEVREERTQRDLKMSFVMLSCS